MTIDDVRNAYKVRNGYWFVPKRFGYGAVPVTWQGWVVTLAFGAGVMLAVRFLPAVAEKIIVSLALIAALTAISMVKTDGEWRWRSGGR
jgi:hypothetical protein